MAKTSVENSRENLREEARVEMREIGRSIFRQPQCLGVLNPYISRYTRFLCRNM